MRMFIFVAFVVVFLALSLQTAVLAADESEAQGVKPVSQAGAVESEPLLASRVVGKTVSNEQGETLGTVADVIAGKNGGTQYLLISPASRIATADRLTPVPWIVAGVRVEEDKVVTSLSRMQLANALLFPQEELANAHEGQTGSHIYASYGVKPEQEPIAYRESEPGPSPSVAQPGDYSGQQVYRYERNPEYQKFGEKHGFYGGMQSWPYSERDRYWPYGTHDKFHPWSEG